jgi:hypothetical protein
MMYRSVNQKEYPLSLVFRNYKNPDRFLKENLSLLIKHSIDEIFYRRSPLDSLTDYIVLRISESFFDSTEFLNPITIILSGQNLLCQKSSLGRLDPSGLFEYRLDPKAVKAFLQTDLSVYRIFLSPNPEKGFFNKDSIIKSLEHTGLIPNRGSKYSLTRNRENFFIDCTAKSLRDYCNAHGLTYPFDNADYLSAAAAPPPAQSSNYEAKE